MNGQLCALLVLSAATLAAQPGYTGPSVLSRPGGPSNLQPSQLSLRPFISFLGLYDTGLVSVSVDESGHPPDAASAGAAVQAGLYAYHRRRRTLVGLDYRGDYRHYTRRTYYNGFNQFATFGVSHQSQRHLQFGFHQMAGTFSRGFGGLGPSVTSVFGPGLVQTPAHAPADELFDSRTDYLNSIGSMTYIKSARMSFNVSGGGFLVRRRSNALAGLSGALVSGDMAYRISRHSTLGVNYLYTKYNFTRSFGGADLHSISANYATSLSRTWELGLLLSVIRVETEAIREVMIDPVVAAIIGSTRGIEAFHSTTYMPGGGARLSKKFRRSSFLLTAMHGVSPGNGLFLTSRQSAGTVAYSYSGFRRWNIGAHFGYRSLSSLGNRLGQYDSVAGGGGFTRSLGKSGFHITGRFDARRYTTDFNNLRGRTQTMSSLGISFSPGDIPLSLW
jgi:hypothetical protein